MGTQNLRKIGNSIGLTLPRGVLKTAGMQCDDTVVMEVPAQGQIIIRKVQTGYDEEMRLARAFMARYSKALRELA